MVYDRIVRRGGAFGERGAAFRETGAALLQSVHGRIEDVLQSGGDVIHLRFNRSMVEIDPTRLEQLLQSSNSVDPVVLSDRCR